MVTRFDRRAGGATQSEPARTGKRALNCTSPRRFHIRLPANRSGSIAMRIPGQGQTRDGCCANRGAGSSVRGLKVSAVPRWAPVGAGRLGDRADRPRPPPPPPWRCNGRGIATDRQAQAARVWRSAGNWNSSLAQGLSFSCYCSSAEGVIATINAPSMDMGARGSRLGSITRWGRSSFAQQAKRAQERGKRGARRLVTAARRVGLTKGDRRQSASAGGTWAMAGGSGGENSRAGPTSRSAP